MVKVKICGITSWADARLAADAGAHLLGFNFYPPSPRYVTPRKARDIVRRLPKRIQAVGVFVDSDADQIRQISEAVGLRSVQLHGEEPPALLDGLAAEFSVIKAFRVSRSFRLSLLRKYKAAAAFLLDGYSARLRGGTGNTFDWSIARRAKRYGKVFLAGGIVPENVAEAIRSVWPYAIDVASGAESRPGKKDAARLRELMDQVASAQRSKR